MLSSLDMEPWCSCKDICPFCANIEQKIEEEHIHIDYETDEDLIEYLEACGTVDSVTGKKIVYTKVPEGEGFDTIMGPMLDLLCDLPPECFEDDDAEQ